MDAEYLIPMFQRDPTLHQVIANAKDLRMLSTTLIADKKHDTAIQKLMEALTVLAGNDAQIPLEWKHGGGIRSDLYVRMDLEKLMEVMICCEMMGKCSQKMGRLETALTWLEELSVIHRNTYFARPIPTFDWMDSTPTSEDFFTARLSGLTRASNIFLKLGNTAAAVHRLHIAITLETHGKAAGLDPARLDEPGRMERYAKMAKLRHPEPRLTDTLELQDPNLQILGSWRKLEVKKTKMIAPRQGFASFVWNGRFYVFGGEKMVYGPYYRDFYYIELEKLDEGWQKLPDYPTPPQQSGVRATGWEMLVDDTDAKAYLFNGRKTLDVFDLRSNTWSRMQTTMTSGAGGWPVGFGLLSFSMALVRCRLYVFGGAHDGSVLGTSLWIVLDLQTKRWRRLSGEPGPTFTPNSTYPGPRKHASMWVDGAEERIWLMYGEADRYRGQGLNQPHGASRSFEYDDCWTWDIIEESWRRERIAGNPPCPRSEIASTYNPRLNRVITFGGYNSLLTTVYPDGRFFGFSYYADTFVYEPSPADGAAPKWKHVLTRGFPIYRAQAKLFSDPATGKTYLFGGYTNSQYVPDRKNTISRSFGDLWQLRLDVPGGEFQGVDIDEEARTAKVGPWQRCFACGAAGQWKRCSGSCQGKAFFCDVQCQKDGWKEHKERHKCSKI
ncbi:hypothetical protein OF83DRAFT_1138114 [Amylostereum chailletii]|nr:hypothetical protein OF83DRAFT_1138114 [Amylostereum chailletii]